MSNLPSYENMLDLRRVLLGVVYGHHGQDATAALASAAVIVGRRAGLSDEDIADVMTSYMRRIEPGQEVV